MKYFIALRLNNKKYLFNTRNKQNMIKVGVLKSILDTFVCKFKNVRFTNFLL